MKVRCARIISICYVQFLQVSELDKSIDVSDLTLVQDCAFMIWHWEWRDGENSDSDEESTTDITIIPETPPPPSDDSDRDDDESLADAAASLAITSTPMVTHTVTFKCIGSTKEFKYQETLARIAQLGTRGVEVSCRVEPEPDNPFDSEAIAFKCKVDGAWKTIGYVVKEALKELHQVLTEKRVTKVSINWVKYIIDWRTPGWYAGVNITRIGEWSQTVLHSQSARM